MTTERVFNERRERMYQGHLNNITHDIDYLIYHLNLALFIKRKGYAGRRVLWYKENEQSKQKK